MPTSRSWRTTASAHTHSLAVSFPLMTPMSCVSAITGMRFQDEGSWDQPEGFRTIGHELGHYALGL